MKGIQISPLLIAINGNNNVLVENIAMLELEKYTLCRITCIAKKGSFTIIVAIK